MRKRKEDKERIVKRAMGENGKLKEKECMGKRKRETEKWRENVKKKYGEKKRNRTIDREQENEKGMRNLGREWENV